MVPNKSLASFNGPVSLETHPIPIPQISIHPHGVSFPTNSCHVFIVVGYPLNPLKIMVVIPSNTSTYRFAFNKWCFWGFSPCSETTIFLRTAAGRESDPSGVSPLGTFRLPKYNQNLSLRIREKMLFWQVRFLIHHYLSIFPIEDFPIFSSQPRLITGGYPPIFCG